MIKSINIKKQELIDALNVSFDVPKYYFSVLILNYVHNRVYSILPTDFYNKYKDEICCVIADTLKQFVKDKERKEKGKIDIVEEKHYAAVSINEVKKHGCIYCGHIEEYNVTSESLITCSNCNLKYYVIEPEKIQSATIFFNGYYFLRPNSNRQCLITEKAMLVSHPLNPKELPKEEQVSTFVLKLLSNIKE